MIIKAELEVYVHSGGYDENMKEKDIKFTVDAIDTIGCGSAIYYYAWYWKVEIRGIQLYPL